MTRINATWRDWMVLAVLALVALALGVMLYFGLLYQNPPIEFLNTPFAVEPDIVRPGDALVLNVDACRYTRVPVVVHRVWQNELLFSQPPETQGGAAFGCSSYRVLVRVPEELPPGEYQINYRFEYDVSPLSFPRIVEATTERFTVVR